MYAICYRYAKNSDQAKDLLQEGFIKVYTKLGEFKFEGSFEGWLKRIFINHALEYIRKELRQPDMINLEDVHDLSSDSFQFHGLDAAGAVSTVRKDGSLAPSRTAVSARASAARICGNRANT